MSSQVAARSLQSREDAVAALDGVDFHIAVSDGAGEIVVSAYGDVDMATAPQLREAIRGALDGEGKVIVDLRGVTFIDSQGLKVLVDAYKRAQPSRADRLVLRAPKPQARKVLEITGLADRLPIED